MTIQHPYGRQVTMRYVHNAKFQPTEHDPMYFRKLYNVFLNGGLVLQAKEKLAWLQTISLYHTQHKRQRGIHGDLQNTFHVTYMVRIINQSPKNSHLHGRMSCRGFSAGERWSKRVQSISRTSSFFPFRQGFSTSICNEPKRSKREYQNKTSILVYKQPKAYIQD